MISLAFSTLLDGLKNAMIISSLDLKRQTAICTVSMQLMLVLAKQIVRIGTASIQ